ncbi:Protein CBG00845 [Caenorhabditis briggsae]|uniref:Protein CBG00845 n=1 Tax=Caenorhabditis briggsae TaxID=6238 RepID=A8WPH2_CAEBR|nr:Protein CBG00845 [Caenorhabditis briggsae]CAP22379.2 Protein CBG00845 [Caenorhabditis briggsae]
MQGGRRDNWITIQIINFLIFGISVQAGKPNITLCRDVPSTWSNISTPEVVVLREHNLDDIRMTSALDDVECWIQKKFHVANQEVVRVETKGDNETICYAISTVDVKRGQMIVVISEGQSAQNCTPNIYGPLPNVLNKIMEKMDQTIPWWVILSVMPMVFFGISVSCYLVIQPRGGLTYTDEEVDFQIQEVDSASRVNVIQPPAPLQNLSFKTAQALPRTSSKTTTSSSESDDVEPPMRTAKEETENHPKTAISGEIPEKMNTAISEKSTKTMRLSATVTNTTAGNSAETISLKTGRD